MSPRVSIIIPFLNASAYLGEAIESVYAQAFRDWELVLVDDGSTDDGPAIAKTHADRDQRIVLISPDPARRGAAAARNRGIAAARGSLISFLDADDLYMPDKLARDVIALDADPRAAWVYGATRWIHENGHTRDHIDRLGVRLDRCYEPPEILARIILEERGDIPCTCAAMIRKGPLDAVGGFEERFALYEDQSLWVKLLFAYPVRIISGCHAVYRQHANSTSTAAASSGDYHQSAPHPARDAFLAWIRDYAVAHGAPDRVMRALATAERANIGGFMPVLGRRFRRMSRFIV